MGALLASTQRQCQGKVLPLTMWRLCLMPLSSLSAHRAHSRGKCTQHTCDVGVIIVLDDDCKPNDTYDASPWNCYQVAFQNRMVDNTYREPKENIPSTEALCTFDICRLHVAGIGSTRMTMSVTVLIVEPITKNSQESIHLPSMLLSQIN